MSVYIRWCAVPRRHPACVHLPKEHQLPAKPQNKNVKDSTSRADPFASPCRCFAFECSACIHAMRMCHAPCVTDAVQAMRTCGYPP